MIGVDDSHCNGNKLEHRKKNKYNIIGQNVFTRFYMLLDQEFHLEKYCGRRLSSCMGIFGHKQKYTGQNKSLSNGSQLS
jgi:hypothetical protein